MFYSGDKLGNGHYTLVKELGQGGMGVVYHCHDEFLQRDIAMKMLLPELMSNPGTVEVFHQEARLAAQLEHPNIVTIFDVGKEDKKGKIHHFIAMEYLPGGNLASRIAHKELSIEHCLNWMKQLANGLQYAHKKGVVHQDIKADNIFITLEGDLKIGDFGLARLAAGRAKNRNTHGMGTPAYMSPELCRGEPQDHRSDIYSMGVLFYEMATGELPFKAKGMIEMAMKHASAPIPSARKINALVPEVLDKVIKRMMSKSPDDRFQSMSEVLVILDDLIFELRVARLGLAPRGKATRGVNAKSDGGSGFFSPSGSKEAKDSPAIKIGTPQFIDLAPSAESGTAVPTEAVPTEARAPVGEPSAKKQVEITNQSEPFISSFQAGMAQVRPMPDSSPLPPVHSGTPVTPANQVPAPPAASPKSNSVPVVVPPRPELGRDFELLWTYHCHGPIGWSSTPVINKEETIVYVASADGTVTALDLLNGKKIWTFETGGPIVSSPTVIGTKLIISCANGTLYAISNYGNLLWKFEAGTALVSTPVVRNETVFVTTFGGKLLAVNANQGFLEWQYQTGDAIVSSPQYNDHMVFLTSKDCKVHAVTMSGAPKWKFATDGPIIASPAVSMDSVYVGSQDGSMYALEADTGRLNWVYATDKPIISRAAIVFTAVIFYSKDRWIYSCEKYDGHLTWKSAMRGRVVANLVSVGGAVYTASREGRIESLNARNGLLRWQLDCGKRLESPPTISTRMLVVGTVEGDLLAYCLSVQAAEKLA